METEAAPSSPTWFGTRLFSKFCKNKITLHVSHSIDVLNVPLTSPSPFPSIQPSEEEIMREQEEKLKSKYGALKPKKKLIQKVRLVRVWALHQHDSFFRDGDEALGRALVRRCVLFVLFAHLSPLLVSTAQDVKYFDSADWALQQVRQLPSRCPIHFNKRERRQTFFGFSHAKRMCTHKPLSSLLLLTARQVAAKGRD